MQRSNEVILTTHTGSLPRPNDLGTMLSARENGEVIDRSALDTRVRSAVTEVVARQVEAGVAVVSDGEMSKIGYTPYVKDRLTGFQGESSPMLAQEMIEFADVVVRTVAVDSIAGLQLPACTGPVTSRGTQAVDADIENLTTAAQESGAAEVFMTAASPGVIAGFFANRYYPSEEEYVFALADAMKPEYDAIAAAGLLLQLDCPDLAAFRRINASTELTDDQFHDQARLHIRALNHAVRDIPADRMRMHVCWGNAEFPHILDIPLAQIIDIVLKAKPAGLLFEAANPRHEHEWTVWEDTVLPDGKVLIPGVLDSTTNFVEHPELVAQRITRFAELVGKENVIAGSDCGFGTFVDVYTVHPRVVWLKLQALAEGADIASKRL